MSEAGKGVGMMQPAERDVLRGPFADAGDGSQAGDALLQRVRRLRRDSGWAMAARASDGERGAAGGGHAECAEVGGGELLRGGKGVGENGVAEREGSGRERDQLCCEPARGYDADLLAEDGADGNLKGIPSAGRAQAGLAAHDGRESAIAREVGGDGLGVGIEIEDAAQARSDDGQRGDMIAGDLDLERVARRQMADGDDGDVSDRRERRGDRCRRALLRRRGWRAG